VLSTSYFIKILEERKARAIIIIMLNNEKGSLWYHLFNVLYGLDLNPEPPAYGVKHYHYTTTA